MRTVTRLAAAAGAVAISACGPAPREYPLQGVVVAVDRESREITIKHDDIPRFMPGMTMPFKVRDGRLLEGRVPGDLVKGTLVVEGADAHLRTLERTGTAPVPPPSTPTAPTGLEPGELVPDASFTDQQGTTRRLSDWRGLALAVTFIYTRCPLPNYCPLMDQHFKIIQDRVKSDDRLRGRVRLLSVSFDPAYDRPAVLDARARQLGADPALWSFVTAPATEIERFARQFGVSIARDNASAQEIVHNLRTAVVASDGTLSTVLHGNEWTPGELLEELRKALRLARSTARSGQALAPR